MDGQNASEHVSFRASSELIAALNQLARRDGVSLSEVIRRAVEERVSLTSTDGFDPFARLKAAATGDLGAQREIAKCALDIAFDERLNRNPVLTLSEGLVFARLAAAHGDITDQGLVICMLNLVAGLLGEEAGCEQLGEAVARVAMAADQGVDLADQLLPDLAASMPAAAMQMAQAYRARITDKIGGLQQ